MKPNEQDHLLVSLSKKYSSDHKDSKELKNNDYPNIMARIAATKPLIPPNIRKKNDLLEFKLPSIDNSVANSQISLSFTSEKFLISASPTKKEQRIKKPNEKQQKQIKKNYPEKASFGIETKKSQPRNSKQVFFSSLVEDTEILDDRLEGKSFSEAKKILHEFLDRIVFLPD